MKKNSLFFIAIFVCFTFFSCSEIPENNDPIIGVWSKNSSSQTGYSKEEWIFNDAYLGRYHNYTNNNIVFLTDFRWTVEADTYTISYPGTDMPNNIVKIKKEDTNSGVQKTETISTNNTSTTILEEVTGETFAIRE